MEDSSSFTCELQFNHPVATQNTSICYWQQVIINSLDTLSTIANNRILNELNTDTVM